MGLEEGKEINLIARWVVFLMSHSGGVDCFKALYTQDMQQIFNRKILSK